MAEAGLQEEIEISTDGPVDIVLDKGGAAGKIVPPEEGLQSLKDQVAKAREDSARRLAEKDRVIAEAAARAVAAEREVIVTRKSSIEVTIERLSSEKDSAKRDWIAAQEAGDWVKAADAQDRLSTANARIVAAEQGRQVLEEEIKAPPKQQPIYVDQVEQVARNLQPKSAAWVRTHPEYVTDAALNKKMIAAHNHALGEELTPESDEYFAHINERLGFTQPPQRQDVRARQSDDAGSNRAPVSAPVGRNVSQTPRRDAGVGTVRLEPYEIASALETIGPLYPKASRQEILRMYAENKLALQSEGKIP